jgi:thymidylate synthase
MSRPFLQAYSKLLYEGRDVSPRGERVIEVENAQLIFGPEDSIISSFRARNLNLTYCKRELLWYLSGDRYDQSIEEHATMWKKLRQEDGGYNSNYGQYLFGEQTQFLYMMEALARDKDSRRAVAVLLQPHHLYHENTDIVCTYGMSFRIRNDKLNMSVNMRSNDLIFGTTNDVFCFGMLHRIALVALREIYPELTLGIYCHSADSLHVYERHFAMLNELVAEWKTGFIPVEFPELTIADIDWIMARKFTDDVCQDPELKFATWLTT